MEPFLATLTKKWFLLHKVVRIKIPVLYHSIVCAKTFLKLEGYNILSPDTLYLGYFIPPDTISRGIKYSVTPFLVESRHMAMQQAQMQTYKQRSRENLAKAYRELEAGDLAQASEKAWGAAALMVKAIAQQRGWRHRSHGWLHDVVDDLVEETGDGELNRLFSVASDLHVNFYEGWLRPRRIRQGIHDVERFVEKVERLLA